MAADIRQYTIELAADWPLFSIPTPSGLTVSEIFAVLLDCEVWTWTGDCYAIMLMDAVLSPGVGYCGLTAARAGASSPIAGVIADGIIRLDSGWNLIGTVGDVAAVDQPNGHPAYWC